MLVKVIDGQVARYPYTENDLKTDWPNTMFPADLSKADLSDFNAAYVTEVPAPSYDHTQNLVEDYPLLVNGQWTQQWSVVPASPAEIVERTEAQWAAVRSDRNARLSDCDWTQLADSPADKPAWASYRQALRDVTAQADPFAINWPVPPA